MWRSLERDWPWTQTAGSPARPQRLMEKVAGRVRQCVGVLTWPAIHLALAPSRA
jgi:hypothetical protein